ncbi:hypothetical protein BH09VER1_BH09VER1_16220 [soil metagenome]
MSAEKHALVIGVEEYLETDSFPLVSYAEKDAEAMAEALTALGYGVEVLLSARATKGRILGLTNQLASVGAECDSLAFFFAGHGAPYDGQNYLVSHDADANNIKGTAVLVREVFDSLAASKANRIMMFLDCCHSGLVSPQGSRSFLDSLDEEEMKNFLNDGQHCVTFSACARDEKSWPSVQFQHGHWTYQLLRALRGEEPTVLKDGMLLSDDLQNFLRVAVKRELSLQRTDGRTQTPKKWGEDDGTFLVADLRPILKARTSERKAVPVGMNEAVFEYIREGDVSDLTGFGKGHFAPKFCNSSGEAFVGRVAEPDVREEIEEVYDAIQRSGKYKSRDVKAGGGSILTPDFRFSVEYFQDSIDPARYVLNRHLRDVSDVKLLQEPWFARCFGNKFDAIAITANDSINLQSVIDLGEDAEGVEVWSDMDKSYCSITLESLDGSIHVEPDSVTFNFDNRLPPQELFSRYQAGMKALAEHEALMSALML